MPKESVILVLYFEIDNNLYCNLVLLYLSSVYIGLLR